MGDAEAVEAGAENLSSTDHRRVVDDHRPLQGGVLEKGPMVGDLVIRSTSTA
jgi:hypothetical protein